MRHVIVAGAIAAILGFFWLLGPPSAAAPTLKAEPRGKWKYKVVSLKFNDPDGDWEKVLTELGAEGWEVVGSPPGPIRIGPGSTTPGVHIVLKRPK
jgi:hypothetical protein